MNVSSVNEMREMDRTAIETFGIPDELLMENAALAACQVICGKFGSQGRRFVIFCGGGNNGGDGLAVARKLHSLGGEVQVRLLSDPAKYKGAARTNYDIVSRLPVDMVRINDPAAITQEIVHADLIIDAIFGTGLTRDVEGRYRKVMEQINRSGKPVMSLDIPSGVQGDTGQIMGIAVQADCTVTFGLPKTGNLLYPGFALGGELYVTHISFPRSLYESDSIRVAVNHPPELPPRNPNGHKGTFGNVLFIAGAATYYGAPGFAALSFMKAGGGYARLAAPRSMIPFLANRGPEIVFVPQAETAAGSIARSNRDDLLELASGMDMVIMGPGMSLEEETQALVRDLAGDITVPLLLDGDGITAVCQNLEIIQKREAPTILTPHPGEMARITGKGIGEIEADRVRILQETLSGLNAVLVLKGAHTLIGSPDGRIYINLSGNAGMGTAGAGDVLVGAIAAMHGMGLSPADAARKGVFIHGMAGDLAALERGEDGITAEDIQNFLPPAMKADRDSLPEKLRQQYETPVMIL